MTDGSFRLKVNELAFVDIKYISAFILIWLGEGFLVVAFNRVFMKGIPKIFVKRLTFACFDFQKGLSCKKEREREGRRKIIPKSDV